jgi:cell division septum initiation protein DivIVA
MKILLKIIIAIVFIIVLSLLTLPYLFQDKAKELIIKEINKNINANVHFDELSLSFFKAFPNVSLSLSGFEISGKEMFAQDTLAEIQEISLCVNLFDLVKNEVLSIEQIAIEDAKLHLLTLQDAKSNYDISKESPETKNSPEDDTGDEVRLRLKKFTISDCDIIYDDRSLNFFADIRGFSTILRGDFSASRTNMKLQLTSQDLVMNYDNQTLLSHVATSYKAEIDADLENEIYTLRDNTLMLNDLSILFSGNFSFVGDDINTILTFKTPKNSFKSVLSLIPAFYQKSFANIQTQGDFELKGNIKGLYTDDQIPDFKLSTEIDNATIRYPDLPQTIENINLKLDITENGGDFDNMIIDLSSFHLTMGKNPVDITLHLTHPLSDPKIQSHLLTKFDLASIQDFYPVENEISGILNADIRFDGKLSSLENEHYEEVEAVGNILLKNFYYPEEKINIHQAQLNFSPAYIDLANMIISQGKNDVRLQGKIENYIPYLFKDRELKAELNLNSNNLNLNDFMDSGETGTSSTRQDTTIATGIIKVPRNIDFTFTSFIQNLRYDDMSMKQVKGNLHIKDERVSLRNFNMLLDDASMSIKGSYTSHDANPKADMMLNIKNIYVSKLFEYFDIIQTYFPFAKNTEGKVDTKWSFSTNLNASMRPVYSSLSGGGEIKSGNIKLNSPQAFSALANELKLTTFTNPSLSPFLLQFEIIEGKIITKEFPLVIGGLKGSMAGSTGLDRSIDYQFKTNIPRNKLNNAALSSVENRMKKLNLFNMEIGIPDPLALNVLIQGSIDKPKTTFSFSSEGTPIKEQVKKKVEEEIQKKKKEVSEEARRRAEEIIRQADQKAQLLIQEAEKQAAKIKSEARIAAQKINGEAELQAKHLIAEAKGKGFIAEAAAREGAKTIRNKAKEQSNNLISEAGKQADDIVGKAKQKAKQLKQNAQKEADQILKI